ncbi:MAG: hypothetical protein GEV11_08750 [Streptosporangiales bacterium]|nr:hypothetical protein [Streptosporangiales bacterium]
MTSATARDPHLDNAKFLAIVLVVVPHAWHPLGGGHLPDSAHLFIYLFHMPLFIGLAGYLSRGFVAGRDRTEKLLCGVLAPYLLFDALYPVFRTVLADRTYVWSPLSPYYLAWFLLALLAWRLSVPLWRRLRHPVLVAVGLSLLAPAVALPDPVVARILGYLPFFVLGLCLRAEHLRYLRVPRVRIAAAALLGLTAVAALIAEPYVRLEWLHWRDTYADLGVTPLTGAAVRLALIAAGVVLAVAFLALVPARTFRFTPLGGNTLYPYLWHGVFIQVAEYAGAYAWLNAAVGRHAAYGIAASLGVVAAVVLSVSWVRRLTGPFVEPRLTALLRPRPGPAKSTSPAAHPETPQGGRPAVNPEVPQGRHPAVPSARVGEE